MLILVARCDSLRNALNGPEQTPTLIADESQTPILASGGAECVAMSEICDQSSNAILERLIDLWPTLNEDEKRRVDSWVAARHARYMASKDF